MKVTTDTPDLLIVESRPILLAIGLVVFILVWVVGGLVVASAGEWWGGLFALFGGGLGFLAFAALVRRVQVVFNKPEAYVEFRRRSLFGGSSLRHRLDEIDRAEVEDRYMTKGDPVYRVVLVIEHGQSAGRHPVTKAYTSGSGHLRAADAINRWLEATR